MGAGAQARPRAWAQYRLDSNTNLAGAAGTTLILSMNTDLESDFKGYFDKPSATRIRALQDMRVRVNYGVDMDANVNEEGYEMRVLKNGSVVAQSVSAGNARALDVERSSVSRTFITSLSANQYLELQINKLEGNTLTAIASGTVILVELYELG